jgi:hypothetical protein
MEARVAQLERGMTAMIESSWELLEAQRVCTMLAGELRRAKEVAAKLAERVAVLEDFRGRFEGQLQPALDATNSAMKRFDDVEAHGMLLTRLGIRDKNGRIMLVLHVADDGGGRVAIHGPDGGCMTLRPPSQPEGV